VTFAEAVELIAYAAEPSAGDPAVEAAKILAELGSDITDPDRPVLRGEMAVLIDRILDPFGARNVDITGNFIE
jgi:hypothetical protein